MGHITTQQVRMRTGQWVPAYVSNVWMTTADSARAQRWKRVGDDEWEETEQRWMVLKGQYGMIV